VFSSRLESADVSDAAHMKVDLIAFWLMVLISVNLRQLIMVHFPLTSGVPWLAFGQHSLVYLGEEG